jgi:hypothetical protein
LDSSFAIFHIPQLAPGALRLPASAGGQMFQFGKASRFPNRIRRASVLDRATGMLDAPTAEEALEVPGAWLHELAAAVAGAGELVSHPASPLISFRSRLSVSQTSSPCRGGMLKVSPEVRVTITQSP